MRPKVRRRLRRTRLEILERMSLFGVNARAFEAAAEAGDVERAAS